MSVLSSPIVIGLAVGIPSFVLGFLGYKRSQKADKATAQVGAVEQVIDGLNKLVDNLQDDNQVLRSNMTELRDNLKRVTVERDKLKREVYALKRKYAQ